MRKKLILLTVACSAIAWSALAVAQNLSASPNSLRGEGAVEETLPADEIKRLNTDAGRFTRAYRQQPPLIPHRIDTYQIDLKVNQCMRCHDWPYNVQEGAPKISETHYIDRQGVALDQVARTRWFCTQCHVPQVHARELVGNDFQSAIEVE